MISTYTYPTTSNRLSKVTPTGGTARNFTYDAAGNTATDSRTGALGLTYQYDVEGRLSKVTQTNNTAEGATYTYDARGRLSSRTVTHASAPTSTTTVYVHDLNDHIIAELNASGQTQREYIWLDDMPVAVADNVASGNPVIYYVHVDHLMRPARMTAQDTSWVWDVIYAPFGGVSYIWSNPANIDLRFPGQWFQLESGLAYNWHRHYDATLGRYVQPDSLGLTAMLIDGPSVYGYVDGNPAAKSDRNGLQSITEERMRHILDAHGQYTRRTRPNSVFNAEYSSPEVLRDLCRSVFQDPSAPPAPLGRGGLWRLNGEVLFRNNDTGQTVPYIIGKDQQGGDTNRVEIWYDPKTGNVQTMFPIDR